MKLKIQIIEDDPITANDLKEILSNNNFEVTGISKSFDDSMDLYNRIHPDLILADIKLKGDKDGIHLAETLQKSAKQLPIIFLSGNTDKATRSKAFKTKPAAFLAKPFNVATVIASIELAIENQNKMSSTHSNDSTLFVKQSDKFLKITVNDILHIEASGSYSRIYTKENDFLISGNLKSQEQKFIGHFMRVHRSYLVNINQIQSYNSNSISVGEFSIPIGRQYKDQVKNILI
ncbi:MAG: LytTR family transcriptional regulator DNA-binding domain-containing protein [Cyclobacteriaceae bacterium]